MVSEVVVVGLKCHPEEVSLFILRDALSFASCSSGLHSETVSKDVARDHSTSSVFSFSHISIVSSSAVHLFISIP